MRTIDKTKTLLLLTLASLGMALPTTAHAGAYLVGYATGGNGFLAGPKAAVYDVKCKTKSPVCASVWDQSPDFSYQDDFNVTATCVSPAAVKGKSKAEYYIGWRDADDFSPEACTPACSEALVTVECNHGNFPDLNRCDDTYAVEVECDGSDFAAGFPKKVQ